jgi:hypothetical protein
VVLESVLAKFLFRHFNLVPEKPKGNIVGVTPVIARVCCARFLGRFSQPAPALRTSASYSGRKRSKVYCAIELPLNSAQT